MNFLATAFAWLLMISVGAAVLALFLDDVERE